MGAEINGYTRVCGLMGNPVEHTMSPAIHNTLAGEHGMNLVYVPFHVPKGQVEEAVRGAFALNLLGVNVTVPYKSEVMPFLEETDPLAEQIGAVNTLVRQEKGFKGYNTDMPGLYRAMCEDGVSLKGERVLILGAGGAARAVAMLAAQKEAAEIILLNRTLEKAEGLAEDVNAVWGRSNARAMALEEFSKLSKEERFLAVQTTNVGMFPRAEETLIEDETFYKRIHTGYDLIFNPARTRFMALVEKGGGRAYNGLRMLLYQGIIAYELWTGRQVDGELARKAYGEMKKAMSVS